MIHDDQYHSINSLTTTTIFFIEIKDIQQQYRYRLVTKNKIVQIYYHRSEKSGKKTLLN